MKLFLSVLLLVMQAATMAQQHPTELETYSVAYQSAKRLRSLDGVVEPVNQSTVSAQTTGVVTEVNFDVDDYVPADAILIRLSDSEQVAALEQHQAQIKRMHSQLTEARRLYKRISALQKSGATSKAAIDTARKNLDSAIAAEQEAKAAMAQSRQQLEYTHIKAPFGGVVTARHIEVGETVRPGSLLMSGFSLQQLRVTVDIPARLVNKIKQYRSARIVLNDDKTITVEQDGLTFYPYANPDSNTVTTRISLPESIDGIYPGMLVKVDFAMGEQLKLSIPQRSVFYRSEVVGVYIIDAQGRIALRHIRAGNKLDQDMIVVLAGLEEGEKVALDPLGATQVLSVQRQTQQ